MVTRITNHEKIGRALACLQRALVPFIESRLRPEQKGVWQKSGPNRSTGWNASALDAKECLEILNKFAVEVFHFERDERAWVNELCVIRNRHAHPTHANGFSDDDTWRALDTAERLLSAIRSPEAQAVRVIRLSLKDELLAPTQHEVSPQARKTPEIDSEQRQRHIAALLLENRGEGTDWGEFQLGDTPWSKKLANRFLLGCLLDYQIDSELAWRNAYRLLDDILGNADDVWRAITAVSAEEWNSKRTEYKLHRFPAAHNRLWSIGKRICDQYNGDARQIWEGKDSRGACEALWDLGAGDQISRMIAGALADCGQVKGAGDVKADRYVYRVLGRAVLGDPTGPETAVRLAKSMYPPDPWQLDAQLWYVGKNYCHASGPDCARCYLAPHCAYALEHRVG